LLERAYKHFPQEAKSAVEVVCLLVGVDTMSMVTKNGKFGGLWSSEVPNRLGVNPGGVSGTGETITDQGGKGHPITIGKSTVGVAQYPDQPESRMGKGGIYCGPGDWSSLGFHKACPIPRQ